MLTSLKLEELLKLLFKCRTSPRILNYVFVTNALKRKLTGSGFSETAGKKPTK